MKIEDIEIDSRYKDFANKIANMTIEELLDLSGGDLDYSGEAELFAYIIAKARGDE